MRILKLLIRSSWRLFIIATITGISTGLFSTLVIKTIHEVIGGESFEPVMFTWKFFLFWLGYGVLSIMSSYSVSLLTQKIIHTLRIKLSNRILKTQFESMEYNQQKLLPILTEDVNTIAYSIDRLPGVTTGLATVIGILIYMVWYSPLLSLTTIILFLLVYLFSKGILPYIRKYADQAREHLNDLFKQFHGLVFGIKELALNKKSQNKFLNDFIIPISDKQNRSYLKENVASSIMNRSTDMILLLGMGALIIGIHETGFVTLEFLGKFLMLVLFTLAPLSTAVAFFSGLKRMEAALKQINDIGLELDQNSLSSEGTAPLLKKDGDPIIHFKKVEHTYYHSDKDQHFAMGPLDFHIKTGELLFIVGGNGSGKTTLAKLIIGLYFPVAGKIEYYGQMVDPTNIFTYRSNFSAIFTDAYLFEKFLNVEKEQVKEHGNKLLQMFKLDTKISIIDHGFSTKNLSDGQKKRLALIISILENKDIYLFDEWAANQDPVFKDIFYKEIIPYLKAAGKTQIIISHDDKYFHLADRIMKLQDGKISEV